MQRVDDVAGSANWAAQRGPGFSRNQVKGPWVGGHWVAVGHEHVC